MAFISFKENFVLVFSFLWVLILYVLHILSALFYMIFPRPRKNIKNDIVLVTGSGMGLGRELAIQLAQLCREVVCVDVMEEDGLYTVKEIHAVGGKARGYVCNVADEEAVMKLGKEVGRVDILVNNAGTNSYRHLENSNLENIRTVIYDNVLSLLWTLQGFLPGMKERNHGHVVCISTEAADLGLPNVPGYAVSKYGVSVVMKSIDQELRREGINVKMTTVHSTFENVIQETSQDCFQPRLRTLKTVNAAKNIVDGILENLEELTIPGYLDSLATFLRVIPNYITEIYKSL